MRTIRMLTVVFDLELGTEKVQAFRGAIVEKVGRENTLFHNHLEDSGLRYKYPSIQYKLVNHKAAIFCVGDGIDEIHNLFAQPQWNINIHGKRVVLSIYELNLKNFNLSVHDKPLFKYKLKNWLGLNQNNYNVYNNLDSAAERLVFLEKILVGNILSFARGIDWQIDQQVVVNVQEILKTSKLSYKGTPLKAFDLEFRSNVDLPNFMGLGKSASHGYGVVEKMKN